MSTSKVRTPENRTKKLATALAAALLLSGCLVDATADELREVGTLQEALEQIDPPLGWSGLRIFVGRNSTNIWVAYKQGLSGSGSCHWEQIGSSGVLWDRTRVHGTSAGDEFRVVGGAQQITVCGLPLSSIPASSKLELYGWAGADVLAATDSDWTNLQIDLGDGSDFAVFTDAYLARGMGGADVLIGDAADGAQIFGGDQDDTICTYNTAPFTVWGGNGNDVSWGSLGFNEELEGTTTKEACAFWRAAVGTRMAD